MKSFATNLVILGLLSANAQASQTAVQQKLSLIAAEMHHYAVMTDATPADLTLFENEMKSFFSQKMQGTLSLADETTSTAEDPAKKENTDVIETAEDKVTVVKVTHDNGDGTTTTTSLNNIVETFDEIDAATKVAKKTITTKGADAKVTGVTVISGTAGSGTATVRNYDADGKTVKSSSTETKSDNAAKTGTVITTNNYNADVADANLTSVTTVETVVDAKTNTTTITTTHFDAKKAQTSKTVVATTTNTDGSVTTHLLEYGATNDKATKDETTTVKHTSDSKTTAGTVVDTTKTYNGAVVEDKSLTGTITVTAVTDKDGNVTTTTMATDKDGKFVSGN